MSTKWLVEKEEGRRFYPEIELATSEGSGDKLPPQWGLVKRFVSTNYLSKTDPNNQQLISKVNFTNDIVIDGNLTAGNSKVIIDSTTHDNFVLSVDGNIRGTDGNFTVQASDGDLNLRSNNNDIDVSGKNVSIGAGGLDDSSVEISGKIIKIKASGDARSVTQICGFRNVDENFNGVPVGDSYTPIYISNAGKITTSNANVGDYLHPIYMADGTLTATDADVASSTSLMYMEDGALREGLVFNLTLVQ